MMLKEDVIAYKERWRTVAEVELKELQSTSVETKGQQLNSIISLAMRLGIFRPDSSEEVVYQRWATLKEKAEIARE